MKKIISAILAISLLLSLTLLSGCISQEEILDGVQEEVEDAIQEGADAFKESIKEDAEELFDRDQESDPEASDDAPAVDAEDPFGVAASKKYVGQYKRLLKKDWTAVLSSYYDNETVVIYQRHARLTHRTFYMVALFEGDTCTYYYDEEWTTHFDNGQKIKGCTHFETFENASKIHYGLQNIYARTEAVLMYQMLVEAERRYAPIDPLKISNNELKEAAAGAGFIDAIDELVGKDGLFGKVMDVKEYAEKAYTISSSTKVDIIKENMDKTIDEVDVEEFAQSTPITGEMGENVQGMMTGLDAFRPNIPDGSEAVKPLWTDLMSFETLGTTVGDVEFRVTDTHLQYKYHDEDAWMDLKELTKLSSDGKNVVFQITNTHIQWRVLSHFEQALINAQKELHEAVKTDGKPALKG